MSVITIEQWDREHSSTERAAIFAKLGELAENSKMESVQGATEKDSNDVPVTKYMFVDAEAAQEYIDFIKTLNPVKAEIAE